MLTNFKLEQKNLQTFILKIKKKFSSQKWKKFITIHYLYFTHYFDSWK